MAEIKVKITDESGQTQTIGTISPTSGAKLIATPEVKQNKNSAVLVAAGTMAIQQTMQYTTSNIGKWTGSSYRQNQVNNLIQGAGLAVLFKTNPVLAVTTTALQIGMTAIDYSIEQKWDKKRSKQDLARLGYSSSGELLGRKH